MNTSEQSSQLLFDVIIVGAGIVGSALACKLMLENPSIRLAVIEAVPYKAGYNDNIFDPRVVALTVASQRLLQDLNAWTSITSKRICPYTQMDVWDGTGTGNIHFDCRDVAEPALGYIAENSIIVEALLEQLIRTSAKILCPAKISAINLPRDGDLALVILEDGDSLRAPLLIAADGANSALRQMAHIETREWNYGHTAIITTAQTELPHNYTARQCFTENGPLAFLPLENIDGDTHFCSIVWSAKNEYARHLLSLDDNAFSAALGQAFEYKLGNIRHVTQRYSFSLAQMHCKQYFKPGVVVVGDAAHTIHPLAGQGVNLGLQDVNALSEEIYRALENNIPLSDLSILQRYQRRRKGPNLAMMGAMEGFKHLFSQDQLPLRWLRNEGMKQLDKAHFIKSKIIREALGI